MYMMIFAIEGYMSKYEREELDHLPTVADVDYYESYYGEIYGKEVVCVQVYKVGLE